MSKKLCIREEKCEREREREKEERIILSYILRILTKDLYQLIYKK
jgi:hypothetical protein